MIFLLSGSITAQLAEGGLNLIFDSYCELQILNSSLGGTTRPKSRGQHSVGTLN